MQQWMTAGTENRMSSKYPETPSDWPSWCHMAKPTEPITVARGGHVPIGRGLLCTSTPRALTEPQPDLWTKVREGRSLNKIRAVIRWRNRS